MPNSGTDRQHYVIDTNVLVVAEGRNADQASLQCKARCAEFLLEVQLRGTVVLDVGHAILNEYRKQFNLRRSGQPQAGVVFLRWLLTNLTNTDSCRLVDSQELDGDPWAEPYPPSDCFARFDRNDRKFISAAIKDRSEPCIVNACDSHWYSIEECLDAEQLCYTDLCPDCPPRVSEK